MHLEKEIINTRNLLKKYFPKSLYYLNFETENCKILFKTLNNNLKFINLLLDFIVDKNFNFYLLLKEYKIFAAKIHTILALNDPFLLSAIIRILVENTYRIIYCVNYDGSNDNSVRKKTRSNMSKRLSEDNKIQIDLSILDNLYRKYSEDIHNTKKSEVGFFCIYETLTNSDLIDYVDLEKTIDRLNQFYLSEVYFKLLKNKDMTKETDITALTKFIENNFTQNLSSQLLSPLNK